MWLVGPETILHHLYNESNYTIEFIIIITIINCDCQHLKVGMKTGKLVSTSSASVFFSLSLSEKVKPEQVYLAIQDS